jgi:photosystem II stability/assembly factor-like uncharacterized protein
MKNLSFIKAVIIILPVFAGWTGFSQSWELLNTGLSSSIKVHSVVFTPQSNYTTGYAVGGDNYTSGVVIKTTDGGTTWSAQSIITTSELYSVSFPANDTGYTCSMEGKVYKTTNGGTTWQLIYTAPAGQAFSIAFRDADHGVLGTPGSIKYTSNGGQSWQTGAGSSNSNSQDISWCGGPYYIATGYGETDISTNAGQSWTSQATPALSLGCGCNGAKYLTTCGDYGTIRVSKDYGATWTEHNNVGDLNHDAAYWDTNYIYVVGTPGIVLKSSNGGQTFSGDGSLGSGAVFCVFITPSFTVYATGSQGKIWRKQVAYPYPAIQLSPDTIFFDTITIGNTQTKSFTITNIGNQDLAVYAIETSNPFFSPNPSSSFTLAPGENKIIEVTFAPIYYGGDAAFISIQSNAPGQPNAGILAYGFADYPESLPNYQKTDVSVNVFPQPFSEEMFIDLKIQSRGNIHLWLSDESGRTLFESQVFAPAGRTHLDTGQLWPGLGQLSVGVYILNVSTEGSTFTKKIIKVR